MSRLVSHDPFTREELHSERIKVCASTCDWCGSAKHTKSMLPYLFRYWIEHDDSLIRAKNYIDGCFCSVDCMRSYHS